ncbi:thiol:disulfide interchange protein [Buchnera aphidicola (Aphis helianthi)]|uniref:Thiol:disulfide interchange protein n=1 Tax=Buchnera aphidicola (Aphis helianthi) TaxID=2315802 RepID=A0A4D6XP78_9GAMM|nr:DsbA family protein [Buchnera aphidicola]QCI17239.1 thiol:disulfide interchange protein [Buchnera aphidicola (Aphis helianthi)]
MKKILIFLCGLFFSYTTLALEFTNTKEYNIQKKYVYNTPKIMRFFSFLCPYCYKLEKTYDIRNLIRKKIDKNISIKTYHVSFLGGEFGKILTKTWIIAEQMGVEEKIIMPIFKGIQETHTINNINNIKKIFIKKTGISVEKYNQFWNSFFIHILIQKNNNDINKIQLNYVPTMLVNGKYIIEYSTLEELFKKNFSTKYIQLVRFLLLKK